PYLIREAISADGVIHYEARSKSARSPVEPDTNHQLKMLMAETISKGTSRKAFRKMLRKRLYSEARFGGKTGSLSGTNPKGRTDWFVGYMQYKDRKIAIGAVSVHEKIWRVRSSQLASTWFEKYLYRTITEEHRVASSEA